MVISYRNDLAEVAAAIAQRRASPLADLAERDPAAFAAAVERARAWRDNPSLLAAALVEQARGTLTPKGRLGLSHLLREAGRFGEALNALGDCSDVPARFEAAYWRSRGEALAGLGRFAEAAAATAMSALPAGKTSPEAGWRLLAQLQARDLSWDEASVFAPAALAAGAHEAVRAAIRPLLARAASAPVEAAPAMIAVARAALDVLEPDLVAGLVERLRAFAPADNDVLTLEVELWLRQGRYEAMWDREDLRRSLDPTIHRLRSEALRRWGREHAAVKVLGVIANKYIHDYEARFALARTVGDAVLKAVQPRFRTRSTRKVFNLVPFNNEIELLHLRFAEMYPWVDQFVIVEARSTFTGQPKPAWFEQRKAEFAPWLKKVSHVILDEFPHQTSGAWARDFWQRDMAIKGAEGLWAPQDIVLLTDADEIVRREAVEGFDDGVLALKMQTYRYFLNYGATPGSIKADGHTGAICTAEHLARYGSSYVRFVQSRSARGSGAISNAGWHFTSLGDAERISGKFAAYAHQEKNARGSESRVQRELTAILGGDYDAGWEPASLDASFPTYIRENQDALRDLLLPVA